MAKSKKEAKKGLRWTAVSIILFACLISLFTIYIIDALPTIKNSGIEVKDEFTSYVRFISTTKMEEYIWPQWILLFFSLGLVSAFVSTADTSLMLTMSSIKNEYYRGKIKTEEKKHVEVNKKHKILIIVAISMSAAAFSIITTDVAKSFTAVLGILGVMGIPVFFSLFKIGNKTTCFLAMSIGLIAVVIANYFLPPQYNDGYYLLLPFIPGFISLVTLFSKRKERI